MTTRSNDATMFTVIKHVELKMRIKLVSDLHLEFSDTDIPNDENIDVLILAGDILISEDLYDTADFDYNVDLHGAIENLGRKQQRGVVFRNFLKRCSSQYPHVVYIAGNHEFYNGKWVKGIQYLRNECAKFPNVYFLECDTKIIDDVVFVGGTLWTDMNKCDPITLYSVKDMMNDFNIIRNDQKAYTKLKPADTVIRHKKTLNYIADVAESYKDKTCVVVGHHCPSHQSIHPQYANDHIMNGAFCSDLSEFILDRSQIKLWVHGHVHHAMDYTIGQCRVVCNPRGYHSHRHQENTGWDPKKVIEI